MMLLDAQIGGCVIRLWMALWRADIMEFRMYI